MDLMILKPDPFLLLCAVILDGLFGDPIYALHPIRLMGATLSFLEPMERYTPLATQQAIHTL